MILLFATILLALTAVFLTGFIIGHSIGLETKESNLEEKRLQTLLKYSSFGKTESKSND